MGLFLYTKGFYMIIKEPLTIKEQVKRLASRGLKIDDVEELETWLKNVGYYRLSGYWWVYEDKYPNVSPRNHKFKPDISWKKIKHTYIFDQKFRNTMFTAIEKIEVALKSLWAQHLSTRYNTSHPHERKDLFKDEIYYNKPPYTTLINNYKDSKEPYAIHYRTKYPELKTPPIWVVTLILTLGDFSNWLKATPSKDCKAIVKDFPYSPKEIISILSHLRWVRNVCAHNGRLWNKRTPFVFEAPNSAKARLIFSKKDPAKLDSKIYNTIIVMSDILKVIDPNYPFTYFIKDMIQKNKHIDAKHMGFPSNWLELDEWKNPTPEHKYNKKRTSHKQNKKPITLNPITPLFHSRLWRKN